MRWGRRGDLGAAYLSEGMPPCQHHGKNEQTRALTGTAWRAPFLRRERKESERKGERGRERKEERKKENGKRIRNGGKKRKKRKGRWKKKQEAVQTEPDAGVWRAV